MKKGVENLFKPIIIGFVTLISMFILYKTYTYKFKKDEVITVTGLADTEFESDQIVWTSTFSRTEMNLKEAYSFLRNDEQIIKNYLIKKGILEKEIVFSSVEIIKQFDPLYSPEGRYLGNKFNGYLLTQSVTVDSKNIEKVEKVSLDANSLIENGIEFNSQLPSYYYSKLTELKLDLLAKASSDAKSRAEIIATNSGSRIKSMHKANMGIFQITGKNTNEDFSYGGTFNTTSRYKKASITLKAEFKM